MTRKLVYAGLGAALIAAFTMFPSIPNGIGGYINLGDAVIVAVTVLIGVWAIPAAAIGSLCADLILGYVEYAPGTFVIKGAMAAVLFVTLSHCRKKSFFLTLLLTALSIVLSECIMIGGYFIYEIIIFGEAYAAASLIPNLVQAAAAIIAGGALYFVVEKLNLIKLLHK